LALRLLRSGGTWTASIVITIAIAFALSVAAVALLNAAILDPLPLRDSGRLVLLFQANAGMGVRHVYSSYPAFSDYRAWTTALGPLCAFRRDELLIHDSDGTERVSVSVVCARFFDVVRSRTLFGRTFVSSDVEGGELPIVISYRLWRMRLGANPSIVGTSIRLAGQSVRVIGILARREAYPEDCDVWLPNRPSPADLSRDGRQFSIVALLRPGVDLQAARTEARGIGDRLAREYPSSDGGWSFEIEPLVEYYAGFNRQQYELILLAGVALIISIAATNIAHLQISRTSRRLAEFAVRQALGASAGSLRRQLLLESAVMVVLSIAGAVPLTIVVLYALLSEAGNQGDRTVGDVLLSPNVLVFSCALAIGVWLACAAAPMRRVRSSACRLLQGNEATSVRATPKASRILLAAEIMSAFVAVVIALAGWRTAWHYLNPVVGFDPTSLITVRVSSEDTSQRPERSARSYQDLLDRLGKLNGVAGAAVIQAAPLSGFRFRMDATVQGAAAASNTVDVSAISRTYCDVMRISVLRGRNFSAGDVHGSALVAVLSKSASDTLWPGVDPIGRVLRVGTSAWRQVVGVVADVRSVRLDEAPGATVYLPFLQQPSRDMTVVIKLTKPWTPEMARIVRREIATGDASWVVENIRSMQDAVHIATATKLTAISIASVLASVAVLLALLGVYGVTAHSLVRQRKELAIRLAMGAGPWTLVKLVLRRGGPAILGGAASGLVICYWASGIARTLSANVIAIDSASLGLAAALIILSSAAACAWAARCATRLIDIRDVLVA